MSKPIKEFKGTYGFLSNFYMTPTPMPDGIMYPSSEHAYQAWKTDNLDVRRCIAALPTPGQAKVMGRSVKVYSNWDDLKETVMATVLSEKFAQSQELAMALLCTAPRELIEGNMWGDVYWGVNLRTGVGKNRLGHLLMELRNDILAGIDANVLDKYKASVKNILPFRE